MSAAATLESLDDELLADSLSKPSVAPIHRRNGVVGWLDITEIAEAEAVRKRGCKASSDESKCRWCGAGASSESD